MGKAWNDATALLADNFGLIASILALYYFLPSFAVALLYPEIANAVPPEIPPGTDPETALAMMSAFFQEQYANSWPFLLIISLAQYVGTVSVLALFPNRGSATVGDALKSGLRGAPSYLATQLIFVIGASLVVGLIGGVAIAISPFLGIPVIMLMMVGAAYVAVKLTLVPAVIGMEGELNPIKAMTRSWRLSKGNSILIFVFLLVLFVTMGLIDLVVSLLVTAVFAAIGGTVAQIGGGFVSSLTDAVIGGVILLVVAAIYRQLASPGGAADVEVFD